jgi:hypothetical protein
VLVQAVQGVAAGAVGPQVLEAAEALLQVAVEPPDDLALVVVGGHGEVPELDHRGGGDHRRDADEEAGPPVDGDRDHEHAGQQHGVAEQLEDGGGGELGEGVDVAVDPLDQQARAVLAVPGEVEPQRVAAQVEPQPVPDPPGQPYRQPGDDQLQPVGGQEDGQVGAGDGGEVGGRAAGEGTVDEPPDEHRSRDRQEHRHDQQGGERDDLGPFGPEVGGEEAGVARFGHRP